MSYEAIITPLTDVRTHPNADRLKLATVHGHQVVVSLEAQNGDLGVFFPDGGVLDQEFLLSNELYNESAVKVLFPDYDTATWSFGFFSLNGRVRAQAFRGARSDGFWCELDSLAYTCYDITKLKAGDMFTELNGAEICAKYYTPATLRAMKTGQMRKQPDAIFPKNPDTKQLKYFIGDIAEGSLIYISEKLHGSAGRYAHTRTLVQRSWLQRRLDRVAAWLTTTPHRAPREWTHLNGSRNVILENSVGEGYYGTNEFRYNLTQNLTLHKGEVLYFEIVGYVQNEMPIMHPQSIKDKDVKKRFGPAMEYTYGCAVGENRLFVYRITRLNEDGIEIDLSWFQIQQRCRELCLATVPMLSAPFFYQGDKTDLQNYVDTLTDGVSTLDHRHIREGVVLRIESMDGVRFLKHKAWLFGVLEGYVKDNDALVDLEEAA